MKKSIGLVFAVFLIVFYALALTLELIAMTALIPVVFFLQFVLPPNKLTFMEKVSGLLEIMTGFDSVCSREMRKILNSVCPTDNVLGSTTIHL